MKKLFDNEDEDMKNIDKAKILVTVLPVILIILVLLVTLIVNGLKKEEGREDDMQQSIKEYADENRNASKDGLYEDSREVDSDSAVSEKEEPEAESTAAPTAQPTPSPYKEIMEAGKVDYTRVEFHTEEQLEEMMAYWADNNQKALDDLAGLDRFIAMSYKLRDTKEHFYFGETDGSGNPNGKGIAVYADNQYYYGDWKNGVRSGKGTWMHYHIHHTSQTKDTIVYHQYTGSWENDLPDGEGSEHYQFDLTLLKKGTGYNANLIGAYSKGLINGEFYLTNIYSDGNQKEWYADAENGSWIYRNENKDTAGRRPVQVEDRDPDNYIWMYPKDNVNLGVSCLISKNKN